MQDLLILWIESDHETPPSIRWRDNTPQKHLWGNIFLPFLKCNIHVPSNTTLGTSEVDSFCKILCEIIELSTRALMVEGKCDAHLFTWMSKLQLKFCNGWLKITLKINLPIWIDMSSGIQFFFRRPPFLPSKIFVTPNIFGPAPLHILNETDALIWTALSK